MSAAINLEHCADCGNTQFPPRSFCGRCLSSDVSTLPIGKAGKLISWTTLHTSLEPGLNEHLPLIISSIKLAEGPVIVAYFDGHPDQIGQPVKISQVTDTTGNPVLVAQSFEARTSPVLFQT
ncbi:MAG: Zn-ribbon domain-containing OB-fold protein [Gammaproteobacteria bacterium]